MFSPYDVTAKYDKSFISVNYHIYQISVVYEIMKTQECTNYKTTIKEKV